MSTYERSYRVKQKKVNLDFRYATERGQSHSKEVEKSLFCHKKYDMKRKGSLSASTRPAGPAMPPYVDCMMLLTYAWWIDRSTVDGWCNGRTNGAAGGRTDGPSYRDARTLITKSQKLQKRKGKKKIKTFHPAGKKEVNAPIKLQKEGNLALKRKKKERNQPW